MILGNDGVRGSGALSYELVCATAGRIHVVAYRLTDDRGVANGKRARIITERLRLSGSAVRRVVRHCEKARRENKRPTRPTPPSPWRLVGHIRRSRIGVQRPAHALPEDLQALPYIPVIVSATPWFVILAVLALILSVISRRWIAMLMALACIGLQVWWQWPFFSASTKLPAAVDAAMASTRADTGDMIARVMTFNVYKGHADAKAIVDIVRDQRVEVLALQETTNDFVKKLDEAGIHSYLPYSQVSSSDGVYGNGIWSATELGRPVDDEVGSSASFMPGGTVTFGGGKAQLRFVSVHTTAPIPGYWSRWKRSLDELASMRSREGSRYVFMGDFNATTDHTPFRNILGNRFSDAARQSGHGFTFTWPSNKLPLPRFAGIDHIVLDKDIIAGQMQVKSVAGSDHAALLATIVVQ